MVAITNLLHAGAKMRPVKLGKSGSLVFSVICTLLSLAPVQVQGALAQGRCAAEVVNPAALDTENLLVTAVAGMTGRSGASPTVQEVQPEVSLLTVQGATSLHIDYN
jgi:hypothetical protein